MGSKISIKYLKIRINIKENIQILECGYGVWSQQFSAQHGNKLGFTYKIGKNSALSASGIRITFAN
jgi:hypothetical protein